jgi:two-component system phosphate regulon response regulator PhoB
LLGIITSAFGLISITIRCSMRKEKNNPIKILVIEDDPDILNALNIVLGAKGFDVDVMLKGTQILQNQFVIPDLFILDKRLPDIDGLEICRYLKSKVNYKDIPVIVISATAKMKKKAMEAGASSFIEKPFVMQQLLDAIQRNLELKGNMH